MAYFMEKLRTDPTTQIKYMHLHGGGLEPGKPGLGYYCDTFALPEIKSKCDDKEYKMGFVEKYGGQWRDLKHKEWFIDSFLIRNYVRDFIE